MDVKKIIIKAIIITCPKSIIGLISEKINDPKEYKRIVDTLH